MAAFLALFMTLMAAAAVAAPPPGYDGRDCVVTEWQNTTRCAPPCTAGGMGTQVQRRAIVSPGAGAGRPCPELTRIEPCKFDACSAATAAGDRDCVVTDWVPEKPCSKPCIGPFGSRPERRSIVTPTSGAGLPCPTLSRVAPCDLDECAGFISLHE